MSRLMLVLGMGTALLGAAPAAAEMDEDEAGHGGSLVEAVRQGSRSQVERLLRQGADPDQGDPVTGWTPLMYAFELGQHDIALLLLRGLHRAATAVSAGK